MGSDRSERRQENEAAAPSEKRVRSQTDARPAAPEERADAVTSTVLFVEDGAANIRLMERILRRRPGVRMVSAPDGAAGLRLLSEIEPDLVLLDLNLPDMPGEVILRQVRSDPSTGTLPVVVISGDSLPAVVQRSMDLGATAYVEKPFEVVEFLRLIDRLLDHDHPE